MQIFLEPRGKTKQQRKNCTGIFPHTQSCNGHIIGRRVTALLFRIFNLLYPTSIINNEHRTMECIFACRCVYIVTVKSTGPLCRVVYYLTAKCISVGSISSVAVLTLPIKFGKLIQIQLFLHGFFLCFTANVGRLSMANSCRYCSHAILMHLFRPLSDWFGLKTRCKSALDQMNER